MYPPLRNKIITQNENIIPPHMLQSDITYAQIAMQRPQHANSNNQLPTHTAAPQSTNDLSELKDRPMMKRLMDQMGTLIKLISALVTNKK